MEAPAVAPFGKMSMQLLLHVAINDCFPNRVIYGTIEPGMNWQLREGEPHE